MSRKSSLIVLVVSLGLVATLMAGVVWRRSPGDPDGPEKQMGTMVEVYQHISEDYVTTPNLAKVADGSLHGLLESLDSDSSYLNPAQYQQYLAEQKNPPTAGVAALISKRVGYANVVDVEPGGNAAQAGLQRGDFVEAIGDQDTRDMSLEEIRAQLAGAPGAEVTLSVVHLHQSDPVKVTVHLAAVNPASLASSVQQGVGVIKVPGLEAGRAAAVAEAIASVHRAGAHALVLDLRNCGAGSYDQAEAVANLFLSHGTITWLEGRTYPKVVTTADAAKVVDGSDPVEVLTNSGTYGPAEVLAAALQQNGRAKVIGDPTYGEGSLQKLLPVGDGSALWLTVARYYTPNGKAVQDGITPDVQQVQYAGALADLDFPAEGVTGEQADLQIQKALALLGAH